MRLGSYFEYTEKNYKTYQLRAVSANDFFGEFFFDKFDHFWKQAIFLRLAVKMAHAQKKKNTI